jgi:hypothetical protein
MAVLGLVMLLVMELNFFNQLNNLLLPHPNINSALTNSPSHEFENPNCSDSNYGILTSKTLNLISSPSTCDFCLLLSRGTSELDFGRKMGCAW